MAKSNAVLDIAAMSFARIVTMTTSLVQVMILSRVFEKDVYGTYAQTLIVMTLLTNITGLGLSNAIKYFVAKSDDVKEQQQKFNTMLTLNVITGLIGAVVIFVFRSLIARYFSNPALETFLIYVLVRPLMTNLVMDYQNLFITKGMAGMISKRNVVIGILQLSITVLVSYGLKDIKLVLLLFVLLDVGQVLYFVLIANKRIFTSKLLIPEKSNVITILKFALPMALALMIGTLNIEIDKLMIGKIFSAAELALYSNMSKELPFSFIATCITSVTFPKIVKYFNCGKKQKSVDVWRDSISIGFIVTAFFCTLALALSDEFIVFLYSEKYLGGGSIFNAYIIVQLFRFTYFGAGLNAAGKSNLILRYSIITLLLNVVLNTIFLKIFGFIGPAYATLISIIFIGLAQLIHGCILFKISFFDIFKLKNTLLYLCVFGAVGLLLFIAKPYIFNFCKNNMLSIIVAIILYSITCMAIVLYPLKDLLKKIKMNMED